MFFVNWSFWCLSIWYLFVTIPLPDYGVCVICATAVYNSGYHLALQPPAYASVMLTCIVYGICVKCNTATALVVATACSLPHCLSPLVTWQYHVAACCQWVRMGWPQQWACPWTWSQQRAAMSSNSWTTAPPCCWTLWVVPDAPVRCLVGQSVYT